MVASSNFSTSDLKPVSQRFVARAAGLGPGGWYDYEVQLIPCRMILQKPKNASTSLTMNRKTEMLSTSFPFIPSIESGQALRFSKDERKVFPRNRSLFRFVAPRDFRVCRRRTIALVAALLLSPISIFAQSAPAAKLQKAIALYGAR